MIGIATIATATVASSRLSWRDIWIWFLGLLKITKTVKEIVNRINSLVVSLSQSSKKAIIRVCLHDLIAVLTKVNLLLISVYICIEMDG